MSKFTLLDLFRINGISPNTKSTNCRTYQIRYNPTDDKRYLFLVKCNESYSNPQGHIVSLYFADKGIKVDRRYITPLQSKVRVHCQCPAYLYWGSAYNATNEMYQVKYQKREFREPNIRDPRRENKLCKHLVSATKSLRHKNFEQIGKGRMSVVSSLDELPTVSINECFSSISKYLSNINIIGQEGIDFISNLNEDNFENQLLSIGMIK